MVILAETTYAGIFKTEPRVVPVGTKDTLRLKFISDDDIVPEIDSTEIEVISPDVIKRVYQSNRHAYKLGVKHPAGIEFYTKTTILEQEDINQANLVRKKLAGIISTRYTWNEK